MHKKKGDGNPVASITREIKKIQLNTILLLKQILLPKSLVPKRVTIIKCGLVIRDWLIRLFITAGESYSNISFSSSSVCFAAPRSQRVRSWAVHPAEFLSNRGTTGHFQFLPSDALLHQMFALSPSFSFFSLVLSEQVITFEYLKGRNDHGIFWYRIPRLWIWNNTPPTGLSPVSLLWLHFQSFLRNLTPCKVDLCNKCTTKWLPCDSSG